jgi:hypothetical protein
MTADGLSRAAFVGRRTTLDQLLDFTSQRVPVVVDGDAGIGKSRLLAELATELNARGIDVIRVFGSSATSELPLMAFGHLLSETKSAGQPGQLALELMFALTTRAAAGPVALLVDDAPRLDTVGLALVVQLVRHGSLAVVLARRSTDELPASLADLVRNGELAIEHLRGLDLAESNHLAEAVAGGPISVGPRFPMWRITKGNPLLIRELVISALRRGTLSPAEPGFEWSAEAEPFADLVSTIRERIEFLSPQDRLALCRVALFGSLRSDRFDQIVTADTRERLEESGLISVENRGNRELVEIGHPLYAEAAMRTITADTIRHLTTDHAQLLGSTTLHTEDDVLQFALTSLRSGSTADVEILNTAAGLAIARGSMELAAMFATAANDTLPNAASLSLMRSIDSGDQRYTLRRLKAHLRRATGHRPSTSSSALSTPQSTTVRSLRRRSPAFGSARLVVISTACVEHRISSAMLTVGWPTWLTMRPAPSSRATSDVPPTPPGSCRHSDTDPSRQTSPRSYRSNPSVSRLHRLSAVRCNHFARPNGGSPIRLHLVRRTARLPPSCM